MIKEFMKFMKEAGELAVRKQMDVDIDYKSDSIYSVVTETDREISRKFHQFVKMNFADLNYVIIDEESLDELGEDKFATIGNTEYQFVIDPVDGTQTYALGMPEYAISVGILRNCRPYMGIVYAPASGEALYCDGKNAVWVRNAFRETEREFVLEKSAASPLAVIFANEWFVKLNDAENFKKDTLISFYSAVLHLFYIATNRAKGYYFGSYIWDMAGVWGALKMLGVEFYDYRTGKVLDKLSPENFTKNFKVRDLQIVCREEDYPHLKEIADLKEMTAI